MFFHFIGVAGWIDANQTNGNFLVSGGGDYNVKVFDKRESKIVKNFDDVHSCTDSKFNYSTIRLLSNHLNFSFIVMIFCVRWSPNGDMIASASGDGTVKVLDFGTGKVIHTETILDEGELFSFACNFDSFNRHRLLSVLHIIHEEVQQPSRGKIVK